MTKGDAKLTKVSDSQSMGNTMKSFTEWMRLTNFVDHDAISFMRAAYDEARKSHDPSTQNGAVIVKYYQIQAKGYNHFPRGINDTPELWADREKKLRYVIHAEEAALLAVARGAQHHSGKSIIYCPCAACVPCAKAIIEAGITTMCVHRQRMEITHERWQEEIIAAFDLLHNADVRILYIDAILYCEPILVNGAQFTP